MEIKAIFFYVFALVMVFSAFRVITARDPVHAVLFMMLAFFQMSGIWLLLQAEFLAVILAIIYLGAVIVLFLFVVMMVDVDFDVLRQSAKRYMPTALLLGLIVVLQMSAVLILDFAEQPLLEPKPIANLSEQASDAIRLGYVLYTEYLYPIQIAAIILLVGMIAAITLTLYRRQNTRYVNPKQQVAVTAQQRLQVVKVPVSKPAPVKNTEQELESQVTGEDK